MDLIHIMYIILKGGDRVKKTETMSLLIERWPKDLHRRLKIEAARQDKTLRQVLVEAASQWLKKRESELKGSQWIRDLYRDKTRMKQYIKLSTSPRKGVKRIPIKKGE